MSIEALVDAQLAALVEARDAVAAYREGRITNEERRAAMVRLEAADEALLDARHAQLNEAARILGGRIVK